ncbi:MAG: IS110 family transposase [Candidatus Omnitrophica bacterium]|nr:IS110 family transposase [Candidatus Omnitrophota bacterium]
MDSVSYIERFRQTKNQLRKNHNFLLVGIDVSKNLHVACIMSASKDIYHKKFRFSNHSEGISSMLSTIDVIKQKDNYTGLVFALEPTGNYHKPLANYLYNRGHLVCYVSSVAAKENRKTIDGRWRKNDPDDAYNVADLLSQGKILFYDLEHQKQFKQLKPLIILRKKLQKRLCSIKAKIRNNVFAQCFPEIDSLYNQIDTPEVIEILKNFPAAEQIRNTSFQEFYAKLAKTGRITTQKKQRIYNVWHKAANSIGCSFNAAMELESKFILQDLELIKLQLEKIDGEINHASNTSEDYKLLLQIPGFGPIYTSIFLAIVKDIKKFNHSDQIVKLAGLDLEYSQSGKYHSKSRSSKKGNALLRYALCGAVNGALKHNDFKVLFEEQLQRKGDNKDTRRILKVKLAVKMIRIAYAVLSKKEPFDIEKIKLNSVKEPVSIEREG